MKQETRRFFKAGSLAATVALLGGCPDPDPEGTDAFVGRDVAMERQDTGALEDADMPPPPMDADVPSPDSAGLDGGPTPDAAIRACPPEEMRPTVAVRGTISSDTRWTCDNNYLIEALGDQGPLYVVGGATLTIEAGTVIRGAVRDGSRRCMMSSSVTCSSDSECSAMTPGDRCGSPAQQGTALVVTRGSRLIAEGTAERPIVFTSANYGNTATPARAGDWGGIVLLGDAPTNWDPPDGAQIEGLPTDEGRGRFGGTNAMGSCGTLRYVRVEYAGYIIGRNNELNGITLGGCGSGTLLDHVQVHLGLDDGVEFFGGSANARYVVVTGTGDDSLDYDLGWSGNVQFFIAQQRDVAGEERCIEADNHPNNYGRMPFSRPTIYNFTCIGAGTPGTGPQDAIAMRRGAQGTIRNSIWFNSPDRGLFVQDSADSSGVMAGMDTIAWFSGPSRATFFENNILFAIGPAPMRNTYFTFRTGSMAAMGVDAVLSMLADTNDEGVDPMLPATAMDFVNPVFAPQAGSPAASGAAPLPTTPAGFWTPADFRGAVRPGGTGADLWYQGWTRFTP